MPFRDVLATLGFRDTRLEEDPLSRLNAGPSQLRALGDSIPSSWAGRPHWPDDNVLVLTRDGYRKCVTAFACINIIADAVAEATLRVYVDTGSGKLDEERGHPLRLLMSRPNPTKSEAEFLALIIRMSAIAGYCAIEKVRSSAGRVVQLWPLRPDWIRPILHDQELPTWEYRVPGNSPVLLPAEDVLLFTYQDDPGLSVMGDTPLRAVLREAGILHGLTDFLKLLLDRGGIPPFVLVVDQPEPGEGVVADDEAAVIREEFRQRYGGYSNWTGPAIIQGVTVQKVGFDLNEMAYKDLRDVIDLTVCRAFRVPPILAQTMAGIESSYGLAYEQSMRALQLYTAAPLRARLDGALSRSLLPDIDVRANISLEFDTSRVEALQENEDALHNRARADFLAGGLTQNEFRQRIGATPIPGQLGDSFFLPFSVVPTLASGGSDADVEPIRARRRQDRRGLGPVETRAAIGQENKLAIIRLGKRGSRQLRAFWKAQGTRIAAEASRSLSPTGDGRIDPTDQLGPGLTSRAIADIDWADEERLLSEALSQLHNAAGAMAWATVAEQLDDSLSWDLANPHVKQVLTKVASRPDGITGINRATQADVNRIIGQALDEGVTLTEMGTRITGLFEETYQARAVAVARTESQVTYNLASAAGYSESGQVAAVELFDNPEHDTDPGSDGLTCAERHNLIVPLGDVETHSYAEHPNGSLSISPVLVSPLGEA